MILRIQLSCIRHRLSRAENRKFTTDSIQQPGTYIQQAHISKSVKGCSSAKSKKRVADDSLIETNSSFSKSSNRSKQSTPRPITKNNSCPFSIVIFCHSKDQKWYLLHATKKNQNQLCHKGHIPVCPQHLSSRLQHLPDDLTEFINNNLQERIAPAMIVRMVKTSYNTTLTKDDLFRHRDKLLYKMLDDTTSTPYGTPIDKMINHFSQKEDVSFMYVMHDMHSGFVTYRKNKDDSGVNESENNDKQYISVYQNDVELWRN